MNDEIIAALERIEAKLDRIEKRLRLPVGPNAESYLSKFEVATLLGVSHRTIDVWMVRRLIPYRKIGRTVRFNPAEIEQWQRRQNLVSPSG